MQSETMDKEELEALAKEMAKGVKTEADLAAVTRTMTELKPIRHEASGVRMRGVSARPLGHSIRG